MRVKKGEEYDYSAEGTWQTSKRGEPTGANGNEQGTGRLVGIVFNDYDLSEPFDLGDYGSFEAPADGNLFLRCNDKWHELEGNKGRMTVRLKVKGVGRPLAKPKTK